MLATYTKWTAEVSLSGLMHGDQNVLQQADLWSYTHKWEAIPCCHNTSILEILLITSCMCLLRARTLFPSKLQEDSQLIGKATYLKNIERFLKSMTDVRLVQPITFCSRPSQLPNICTQTSPLLPCHERNHILPGLQETVEEKPFPVSFSKPFLLGDARI